MERNLLKRELRVQEIGGVLSKEKDRRSDSENHARLNKTELRHKDEEGAVPRRIEVGRKQKRNHFMQRKLSQLLSTEGEKIESGRGGPDDKNKLEKKRFQKRLSLELQRAKLPPCCGRNWQSKNVTRQKDSPVRGMVTRQYQRKKVQGRS